MKETVIKAINLASDAHKKQTKKGTDIPYITHPLLVGMILIEKGAGEKEIIAGILHDTLEDTELNYKDIKKEFGKEVADVVKACSEDKKLHWEERKRRHIEYAKNAPTSVKRVMSADKLANLYMIKEDLNKVGEKLWSRFRRGKGKQKWYYSNMAKSLESNTTDKIVLEITEEMKRLIDEIFGQVEDKS